MSEPFKIDARRVGAKLKLTAMVDGEPVAFQSIPAGSSAARKRAAREWSADARLLNGQPLEAGEIERRIERADILTDPDDEAAPPATECASFVDDDRIVELAWDAESGEPDFIIYDRNSQAVSRVNRVDVAIGSIIPPAAAKGVCTPGAPIPGNVYLPTACDEAGTDEDQLRAELLEFIDSYVELPTGLNRVAVEYVLLTWVFDAFDELPYLSFRTPDMGRGKSRALETIGSVCYRPIFCGGGSTAAATLRLVHQYGGSLVCDEMDQRDTELASEVNKIFLQGFQSGRPLVRCSGEDNEPTPFRCFGPKLFALRKGFADDALESRMISITMTQRTRKDIPINLPRRRFDDESRALRNKLLAWRCCNLAKVAISPALADPTLEDRFNQIGLPLLSLARTDEDRRLIRAALAGQQDDIAQSRSESWQGEVFGAILRLYLVGDIVRPSAVAHEVNRRRSEADGIDIGKLRFILTREKAGSIIRRDLAIPHDEQRRDADGVRYKLTEDRSRQLRLRFGHPLPEPTQPTQPTQPTSEPAQPTQPTSENRIGAIENAVNVSRVSRVGFPGRTQENENEPTQPTQPVWDFDRMEWIVPQ